MLSHILVEQQVLTIWDHAAGVTGFKGEEGRSEFGYSVAPYMVQYWQENGAGPDLLTFLVLIGAFLMGLIPDFKLLLSVHCVCFFSQCYTSFWIAIVCKQADGACASRPANYESQVLNKTIYIHYIALGRIVFIQGVHFNIVFLFIEEFRIYCRLKGRQFLYLRQVSLSLQFRKITF